MPAHRPISEIAISQTLHSLYLSQITLFTARILTICRHFATLTVPRGISYIEQIIVLKSIVSPTVFAVRTFGYAGDLFLTWGNYNHQWIAEVGITIGILLITIASATKLELIKDKVRVVIQIAIPVGH